MQKKLGLKVKNSKKHFERLCHQYNDCRKKNLPNICGTAMNLTRTTRFFQYCWNLIECDMDGILPVNFYFFLEQTKNNTFLNK